MDRTKKSFDFIKEKIKKVPLWVWLIILGIITFCTYDISITTDMAWYMNSALNLYVGKGYTIENSLILGRGPLFSLMIAASFWLLGVSAWSAFWVVRIFAILNPVLIYFIGKRFYNKWVGFIAGLLILTSYSMNHWSYRHVDGVWVFFAILAVFFLYKAFEEKKYVWFTLSGIALGLGFLIKETTLVFFPLAIAVLFIKSYRHRYNIIGIFIIFLVCFLVISPWMAYVYINSDNLLLIFGDSSLAYRALNVVHNGTGEVSLLVSIKNYIVELGKYFYSPAHENALHAHFLLLPIFILAWFYTGFSALNGEKENIIMFLIFLLYSPVLSHAGRMDLRIGQSVAFLLITYLATANFLVHISQYIYNIGKSIFKGWQLRWLSQQNIIIGLTLIAIFMQFDIGDKKNKDFLMRSFVFNIGEEKKIEGSGFNERNRKLAEWILNNFPIGSRIMDTWFVDGKALYFITSAKYPMYHLPLIRVSKDGTLPYFIYHKTQLSASEIKKGSKSIIFLSSWKSDASPKNYFLYLIEENLLKEVRESNIDYVIVNPHRKFLNIYFEKNSSFIRAGEVNGVKIFEVNKEEIKSIGKNLNTLITENVPDFLNALKRENPSRYFSLKEHFLKNILEWDEKSIEDIEEKRVSYLIK